MTYAIVAHSRQSGELGIAVATALPAVGGVVPHVEAGVGAVAFQGQPDPRLVTQMLDRLRAGDAAETAMRMVLAQDPHRAARQVGMVDARGRPHGWTGSRCTRWAGHSIDGSFVLLGNTLAGPGVLRAMAHAMQSSAHLPLAEQLLMALSAGDAAGGDRRGRRSAALKVSGAARHAMLDLRADDDPDPVQQLRRAYVGAVRQPPARSPAGGRMAVFASRGVQVPQDASAPPLPGAL
ncbi:DUF1028 domain-containing protein [Piscinibacter defluvii]|uniref:DUF1028 domain-containing protein n=1 Tax=Piscinibacter defluvii TaxID=1796922 RepID=UPI0013E31F84|nr:DUF1028 domain-containing protein [Piscinibacter defluvii]